MLQIGRRALGAVLPPEPHMVRSLFGQAVKGDKSGLKRCLLGPDQGERRETGALMKGELQLELDPDVPDVLHWLPEPTSKTTTPGRCDPMDDSPRPGVTGFGVRRLGQSGLDEAVQCSIDEGSTHGEDPSHLAIRSEVPGDGESMCLAFGEEAKHRVLGQGELGLFHLDVKTLRLGVVACRIVSCVFSLRLTI